MGGTDPVYGENRPPSLLASPSARALPRSAHLQLSSENEYRGLDFSSRISLRKQRRHAKAEHPRPSGSKPRGARAKKPPSPCPPSSTRAASPPPSSWWCTRRSAPFSVRRRSRRPALPMCRRVVLSGADRDYLKAVQQPFSMPPAEARCRPATRMDPHGPT